MSEQAMCPTCSKRDNPEGELQAAVARVAELEARVATLTEERDALAICDKAIRDLIAAPAGTYTFTAVLDELNRMAGKDVAEAKVEAVEREAATLREAVTDALNVLGTGDCTIPGCEACRYERGEASDLLRAALAGAGRST